MILRNLVLHFNSKLKSNPKPNYNPNADSPLRYVRWSVNLSTLQIKWDQEFWSLVLFLIRVRI